MWNTDYVQGLQTDFLALWGTEKSHILRANNAQEAADKKVQRLHFVQAESSDMRLFRITFIQAFFSPSLTVTAWLLSTYIIWSNWLKYKWKS